MIEVEILCRSALDAFAAIAAPDFDFHRCRNQSVMRQFDDSSKRFLLHRLERELEYLSFSIGNGVRIDQLEEAFVAPDSARDLFINFDQFGLFSLSRFEVLGSLDKLGIFRGQAAGRFQRLINLLRIGSAATLPDIVSFIHDHPSHRIDSIAIRSALSQRHDDRVVVIAGSTIHPGLKPLTLFGNDFVIAKDVVDFHSIASGSERPTVDQARAGCAQSRPG